MTVELWCLGKSKSAWVKEAVALYEKRLRHLHAFNYREYPLPKASRGAQADVARKVEADLIGTKLGNHDLLLLFDERGKSMTSRSYATYLERLQHRSGKRIVFLIGGAYGFDESLRTRAGGSIRLSDMTLSHQLARIVALEQLYRGYTILKGLPYHND